MVKRSVSLPSITHLVTCEDESYYGTDPISEFTSLEEALQFIVDEAYNCDCSPEEFIDMINIKVYEVKSVLKLDIETKATVKVNGEVVSF